MQTPELKNIQTNHVPFGVESTSENINSNIQITETIRLQFPLSADGMAIETLTMRRPLVRDRLAADKANGSEVEKEIRLIANLCEMAPQHIELLDLADYTKLQECLTGFLS